jgi:hypothetical protein
MKHDITSDECFYRLIFSILQGLFVGLALEIDYATIPQNTPPELGAE